MAKCTFEYSKGKGTGVSEAIGNWGFSNEVASPGHELSRIQCILEKMGKLRDKSLCTPAPKKKSCLFKPASCQLTHRKLPEHYPLVLYGSVNEVIPCADRKLIRKDNIIPALHRSYCLQGTDKWYKCWSCYYPQPSCPVACSSHG
ncbi:PREDICTED: uncharacterized protein LOC105359605 [Ceratosolen solmsi marchali]|uniref:Uncharacterized protein LOC105359605 n=1 Tax=Ceratosolen solmsi marchali TaxID=326594 RepID=A0AAJ6YBN4_9HYME|nr:PREDICTED: uncharacterized protein LOC105359605 [Ceratosolen solmsi marchali]